MLSEEEDTEDIDIDADPICGNCTCEPGYCMLNGFYEIDDFMEVDEEIMADLV